MNPKQREFENDFFLKSELKRIIFNRGIRSVVETGTEYGGSANAFAMMEPVKIVMTLDISKKVELSDLLPNVHFVLGDSAVELGPALDYIAEPELSPTLFFLDAHSSIETDTCPLRDELRAIKAFVQKNTGLKPPVIAIHDCVVPGHDFGFDVYAEGPICWEYVSDLIDEIFGKLKYTKRYNTVASGSRRGCMFIEPI